MFLFLFVLWITNSIGQTKIWGVGAPTGQAEAEFQNPIDTAASTTAWQALSISDGDGTNFPGAAYWIRSISAQSQGAYFGTRPAMASPSVLNGVAIFDSDFMDNNGTQGAFGTGTSPGPHIGDLISPRIDLTGYTDSAIAIKANVYWRNYQANPSIGFSTDDGLTWTDVLLQDILPLALNATGDNDATITASFCEATAGVANLTQCRIRFRFDGYYYFMMVDDVTLEIAPQFDFAIAEADPAGTTLGAAYDYTKVGNYRYMPQRNIDLTNLNEWYWGLEAINKGCSDILPTTNPRAIINIDHTDPNGVLTSGVFSDTIAITDTILGNQGNNTLPVQNFTDLNFINNSSFGTYAVKMWLDFNGSESNLTNDTTLHFFTTTGSSPNVLLNKNYMSKCRLRGSDGKVNYTRPIFPGGTDFSIFEYGSMFFFPKGLTDSVRLDSVDFRYYIANAYSGANSQTVAVNVYNWLDGSNGGASDGIMSGDELTLIGLSPVTLNNLTGANGTYNLATATSFVDAATGNAMPNFIDNGFYLITLYENPSALGGTSPFTSSTGVWFGADEYNYALNATFTNSAAPIPHPSPVQVIDGTGTGDWNWVGFGADMVPSIGLYLDYYEMPTADNLIFSSEGMELSVYPNPVNTTLTIELELNQTSDVTYILTDMTGKVITMAQNFNVSQDQIGLNVSDFPTGVYFITAKTNRGETTQKFIKQ